MATTLLIFNAIKNVTLEMEPSLIQFQKIIVQKNLKNPHYLEQLGRSETHCY